MRRMIPNDAFSVEDGDVLFGKNVEVDGKIRLNGAEDLTDKDGTPLIGGGGGGGGIEILDTPPSDPSKIIGLYWKATVNVQSAYWTGEGEGFSLWITDDSEHTVTVACGRGGGTSLKAIASIYYRGEPTSGYISTYDENCVVYDPDGTTQMAFMGGTPAFTYKYICYK